MAFYEDDEEEIAPVPIGPGAVASLANPGVPNKEALRQQLYASLAQRLGGEDPALAEARKSAGDEDRRNAFLASLQQSANQLGTIGGRATQNNALSQMAGSIAQSNAAGLASQAQSIGQKNKVQDYLLSQIQKSDAVDEQMKQRAQERAERLAFQQKQFDLSNRKLDQDRQLSQADLEYKQGRVVQNPDGTTTMAASAVGKMPNKDQFDAATYGRRLQASEAVLDNLEKKGYDRTSMEQGLKSKFLPGAFQDENLKSQEQAERNFVNAVLRRESGAAISNKEFESAEMQYFPRTGDGPEVLAQKKQNRLQALAGMQGAAGNAWDRVPGVPIPEMGRPTPEAGTAYGAESAPKAPPPAGKVRVRSPDGKVGLIPKEDLNDALAEKYEVIE
jgi:flagella basal body P-ring formation protein FlgA